jgi:peptide/nickel transport system permease protein
VAAYLLRRLLVMPPILFGVSVITFLIINAKGSPLARFQFNARIRPEDIERMERNLGLDKSVLERYWLWMGSLLRGDLGVSLYSSRPVIDVILAALPNTLRLAVTSLVVALLVAIPVAIYAATHRSSLLDRVILTASVAGASIPSVWLALLLIILFAVQFRAWGLPALPIGNVKDPRNPGGLLDLLEHMVLPVAALAVPQVAGWVLYIRSTMLEVLSQDYIRTARAAGLRERTVRMTHGFRNAFVPIVTLAGLAVPEIFAGALIVENVFSYPGMGQLTVTAVSQNDYTVVMGTTIFYALLVMTGNLLADLLYPVVDPRLRR